ncbi:hypothetical protein FPG87_12470 [Flavobacterium psychrophilum]|uniref:Uncharacterized protein n=1 Tax=Flavobacterium psychrophilum TaxID=96345 RepID=A0A7U2NHS2_FLAPS|nr:hypothetical protein [Flavobacterium psychrophilum]MBF2091273.1 hypothetical protein [Flavobacterium psychrophilum]OAE92152.1 hypothetical protein SU65_10380 [Flavobacterium psychrophilum]OJH10056.1 hypothetical protein FPG87_12470 [Flavobacterium psychrophilum]QRE05308.1 hypothetical protein H0H26_06900 [Flavobacterium psychrophilum]SNA67046.1 conserved hypothetical protein [Flavobacterium psychrophilum]
MILPFSTKINGKESYFVEKIIKGLYNNSLISRDKAIELLSPQILSKIIPKKHQSDYIKKAVIYSIQFDKTIEHKPKIHTIREDKKNRWKVGTKIDFFINARQKNMFRFVPVLPVVSTQEFEINWHSSNEKLFVRVYIDGESFARIDFDKELYVSGQMLHLANNDGFDTIEAFFDYFNKDYKGKIIHWTNFKY